MKWGEWKKGKSNSTKMLWCGPYTVGCIVRLQDQGTFFAYTRSPTGVVFGNECGAKTFVEANWLADLQEFPGGVQ
jgi:hypothetical protein